MHCHNTSHHDILLSKGPEERTEEYFRSVRTKRKERLKLHQENSLQEKVTFKEGSNRLNSNGQSFTYFTHIQPEAEAPKV